MRFGPKARGWKVQTTEPARVVIRPLENSARAKGVKFLLNYKMTSLIRKGQKYGARDRHHGAVHAENHAGTIDAVKELSLRRQHR